MRFKGIVTCLLLVFSSVAAEAQTISNDQVTAYADSARVSFDTDEPTTAVVKYGLTTAYGSLAVVDDTLTAHSILLASLMPDSTYFYRIVATDTLGQADSLSGQFTQLGVPDIQDLALIAYADSARITFTSHVPTTAVIDYGIASTAENQIVVTDTLLAHSVLLPTLTADTAYLFDVTVTDTLGATADSLGATFTTAVLPTIANLASVGLAASAIITFDTNVPSTAVINYGTTVAYGSQVAPDDTTSAHSITINGLSSNTQYFYEVVVTDTLTQTASKDSSVTTTSIPVVSNIAVTDTTANSFTVTFDTDVRTFGYVEMRDSTDAAGKYRLYTVTDSVLATSHTVVVDTTINVTGWAGNVKYYIPLSDGEYEFRIVATDSVGNVLKTPSDTLRMKPYGGALPSGWSQKTIGPTTLDGRATFNASDSTFSVIGQGSSLFNASDNFHFVYKDIEGDFVLRTRITWTAGSLSNLTKGGTHFRVDTTAGSAMVNHSYNYRYADYFYYRVVADQNHDEIATTELQAFEGEVIWARLTRSGNDFTSEYSSDGVNWSFHGPSSGVNIPIPRAGMLGLVSLSKDNRLTEHHYDSLLVELPEDVTPPVISGVSATPINNTGQVDYDSNEWVTTIIDYGLTTSYTDSVYVDTVHVSNLVTLSDLLFSTEYHYRIRAFDADSNEYVSPDMTFITEDQDPLSVELAGFSGAVNNGDVLLSWAIESSDGLARFDVQQEMDESFTTLGSVDSPDQTQGGFKYAVSGLDYGIYTFRLRVVHADGSVGYSEELEVAVTLASSFELMPAYPNPFNTRATIGLTVRDAQHVRVELFNAAGQLVRVLHDAMLEGNATQSFEVDGSNLSGGIYFYRVRGSEFSDTGKIVLLK